MSKKTNRRKKALILAALMAGFLAQTADAKPNDTPADTIHPNIHQNNDAGNNANPNGNDPQGARFAAGAEDAGAGGGNMHGIGNAPGQGGDNPNADGTKGQANELQTMHGGIGQYNKNALP